MTVSAVNCGAILKESLDLTHSTIFNQ